MKNITKKIIPILLFASSWLIGLQSPQEIKEAATQIQQEKTLPEKPIVVSICSYNNADFVEKNLDSVFTQNYENFIVYYVDDASNDGTAEAVKEYAKTHGVEDKLILIQNKTRRRKMHNMYTSFHKIDDESIIVQLDGDDWFAHKAVLQTVNENFTNNDIWLSYGQFANSDGKPGYAREVPRQYKKNGQFRKVWVYMPTRAFYAWLFKQIKLEDVLSNRVSGFEGKFYPASNDLAMMFPMVEMARDHYKFVNKVSYIRNRENPLSGFRSDRKNQGNSAREIFGKRRYQGLKIPIMKKYSKQDEKIDVLILAQNSPENIPNLIKQLSGNTENINNITIIYEGNNPKKQAIERLNTEYKHVQCINAQGQLKETIINILNDNPHRYILLANNTSVVPENIDIKKSIEFLNMTHAYGFFFNKKSCKTPSQHIEGNVYAWKFLFDIEKTFNSTNVVLVNKETILNKIRSLDFSSMHELTVKWKESIKEARKVGLFTV